MTGFKIKKWEIAASTGTHFDVLDGLRGVAILLVVANHAFFTNPARGGFSRMVGYGIQSGWMGVPIFFALSGFLISYSFYKNRESDLQCWHQRGYLRRRIGKIIPPFYLSIILFAGCCWLSDGTPIYWKSGLIWATGLGNFVLTNPPFNEYYWSLIVESHFYIILPVLMWLFRGLSIQRLAIALFLILFFVPLLARCLTWPQGVYTFPDSDRNMVLLLKRFPTQLDYFAWGVLLAGIFVSLKPVLEKLKALSAFGYVGLALLATSLIFLGVWQDQFDIRTHPTRWSEEVRHFLPAISAFLMMFFIFDSQCLGARVLSWSWLRFTGIISYEWFLFHPPVCHWFLTHNSPSHGNVAAYAWQTLTPVILTFVFSAFIYRYFSLPILNRVRDSLKTKRL